MYGINFLSKVPKITKRRLYDIRELTRIASVLAKNEKNFRKSNPRSGKQRSIAPMLCEQLLHAQILKAQKKIDNLTVFFALS